MKGCVLMRIFSRLITWQHGHWRMNWVIVRSVIVGSLRNSLHFCKPHHGVVYRSNLFKNCIWYAMLRLNRGQEGLMPHVGWLLTFVQKHVILTQTRQCVRDVLMKFLSRNMAQVEVFILQIKFPSLYLPGQCDVKVG